MKTSNRRKASKSRDNMATAEIPATVGTSAIVEMPSIAGASATTGKPSTAGTTKRKGRRGKTMVATARTTACKDDVPISCRWFELLDIQIEHIKFYQQVIRP